MNALYERSTSSILRLGSSTITWRPELLNSPPSVFPRVPKNLTHSIIYYARNLIRLLLSKYVETISSYQ